MNQLAINYLVSSAIYVLTQTWLCCAWNKRQSRLSVWRCLFYRFCWIIFENLKKQVSPLGQIVLPYSRTRKCPKLIIDYHFQSVRESELVANEWRIYTASSSFGAKVSTSNSGKRNPQKTVGGMTFFYFFYWFANSLMHDSLCKSKLKCCSTAYQLGVLKFILSLAF